MIHSCNCLYYFIHYFPKTYIVPFTLKKDIIYYFYWYIGMLNKHSWNVLSHEYLFIISQFFFIKSIKFNKKKYEKIGFNLFS